MKRYDLENYEDSLSIMDVATDGDWVDYYEAVDAIQQTHREGWEQAKRECEIVVDKYRQSEGFHQGRIAAKCISDAIAAMEYKEKANE